MKNIKFFAFADEADKNIDGQISALKDNQLNGLEIRGIADKNIADLTLNEAKEIKQKLDSNNLTVWSIGSPCGKIGINDNFEEHLDKFKHMLELSEILEAKAFRLFSFFMPENENPDDYKDQVLEKLNKFCETAKGFDIILCHENEKAIYGDTAKRCLEIHKSIPSLKAVFDPANFIQCGEETLKAFDLLKDYVFYMHIKDSLENGEIVPAGKGIGHIKELTQLYKGGIYTLEPHLFEFSGLKNLEKEGDESIVGNCNFSNARLAFDFASNSFKEILKGND